MSAVIKTIEDMLHNKIYPKTKVEAVYDNANNRLDSLLSAKEDASDDFVLKGTSESVPSISDPVLHQSDISTTQSTATDTVPSSSLVKTMNDSITQLSSDITNLIKSDSFSGTTDIGGDLKLSGNISDRIVLCAFMPGYSYIIVPRIVTTGDWYINIQKYISGSNSPVFQANITVSGTYYYIER